MLASQRFSSTQFDEYPTLQRAFNFHRRKGHLLHHRRSTRSGNDAVRLFHAKHRGLGSRRADWCGSRPRRPVASVYVSATTLSSRPPTCTALHGRLPSTMRRQVLDAVDAYVVPVSSALWYSDPQYACIALRGRLSSGHRPPIEI